MIQSHQYNDTEILERWHSGDHALRDALTHLVSHVMVPLPNNFTPPERTPWGGTRIRTDIKHEVHPLDSPKIVGESWEISSHPSFPSRFALVCEGREMTISFPALEAIFPDIHLPYLVKFINSGSDQPRGKTSVQVHPTAEAPDLRPGEHSKTEAWIIIDAEPGAGIYLDLKEGVTRPQFEQSLHKGQNVTSLLNFVEVKPGDVFFVPAGTLHAIGAGVLLLEPQETSDTTYRVHDFGRIDAQGKPRPLHIDRALVATRWDGPRGMAAVAALRRYPKVVAGHSGNASVERLLDEKVFSVSRIALHPRQEFISGSKGGTRSYIVLNGAVSVFVNGMRDCELIKGQSCIVPKSLGGCVFKNHGKSFSELFEITPP